MFTFVKTYRMEIILASTIILLFGICIYGIVDTIKQINKKD